MIVRGKKAARSLWILATYTQIMHKVARLVILNEDFKGTPLFDDEYQLQRISNYTRPTQRCNVA